MTEASMSSGTVILITAVSPTLIGSADTLIVELRLRISNSFVVLVTMNLSFSTTVAVTM